MEAALAHLELASLELCGDLALLLLALLLHLPRTQLRHAFLPQTAHSLTQFAAQKLWGGRGHARGAHLLALEAVAPEPLPRWARDACAAAAASDPSSSRPVPNHVLVNSYDFAKESYVLPHTDGPAYDDRTFTLSCGADAVVVFKERLKTSDIGVRAAATRCEVLLRRRSLLAFSREAYTECTHEIGASPDTLGPRCANLDAASARVGDVVGRAGERVSFTLRCASGAE